MRLSVKQRLDTLICYKVDIHHEHETQLWGTANMISLFWSLILVWVRVSVNSLSSPVIAVDDFFSTISSIISSQATTAYVDILCLFVKEPERHAAAATKGFGEFSNFRKHPSFLTTIITIIGTSCLLNRSSRLYYNVYQKSDVTSLGCDFVSPGHSCRQ